MSLQVQLDAIHAWMAAATGIACIWANDGGPRPAYPYAQMNLIADVGAAEDHRWTYNDQNPVGQEMELDIRIDRELTLSLQTFAKPGPHTQSAHHYMDLAKRSLAYPSHLKTLRDANLAPADIPRSITDLSGEVNGEMLLRAGMDLMLNTVTTDSPASERQPYIDKVQGQITYERPDETTKVDPINIDTSGV